MIRNMAIGLVSAVALISAANAADMYRPEGGGYKDGPVYVANTWTGFYIGANGGYGWNADTKDILYTYTGGATNRGKGFEPEGGFGGGQIGYNWQGGVFGPRSVMGIEADIQGADISDSFNQLPAPGATCCGNPNDIFHGTSKLDWFGTVRGRLGYAFDRTLIYATGGFAFGNIDQRITAVNPALVGPNVFTDVRKNDTRTGFVVGGGVEYAVSPAWSIKGEYQYLDFGSDSLTGTNPLFGTPVHTNEIDNTFHTVRLGLNYHIHQGYEPLK